MKHGMSYSRVYRIWIGMKARCLNPKHPKYPAYGAKGIDVCKQWLSFENFFADMGHPPTDKHTLDRRVGSRGYNPQNCQWSTPKEQSSNIKSNVMLTFKGKTQTMSAWCNELGLSTSTLQYRISRGWSVEQALMLPRHARVRLHDGGWKTKRAA